MSTGPYRTIIVPTDFSLPSEEAVVHARNIAEMNGQSTIVLLYVVVAGPFAPIRKLADDRPEVEPEIRETIVAELSRIRDDSGCDPTVLPVELAVTVARNAALGICRHAEKIGADLLVMSRRGRGGLEGVTGHLIGSTTEKVVRHAPCAVMTFRSEAMSDRGTEGTSR